jgi:transposase
LSRGDRNRNARLVRLRELVPYRNAIVGIELADDKQAAVVAGHDSRVIARRQVRARRGSWVSCWTGPWPGPVRRVLRR